jgi:hypothetical protein
MTAALKPAPCTDHAELVIYETTGGWPDDHSVEKGCCTTCGAWVAVTVDHTKDPRHDADAITVRSLTTAEITILKYLGRGDE